MSLSVKNPPEMTTVAAVPTPATTSTAPGSPRVLLFTDSDAFAGTERHMLDLARGLRLQEIGVGIACPVPSPLALRAAEEGIPVTPIAKQGMIDRAAIRTLRGMLASNAINVIHSHNGRTALLAAAAVSRSREGVHVTTQHFITPTRSTRRGIKGLIGRVLHKWVSKHTDRVIAISRAVERGMVERGESQQKKISIVANGIVEPDPKVLPPRDRMRAEFDVVPSAPLIVAATRLVPEKDVGTLINAIAQLREVFPSIRCLIAGEGQLHAELDALVEKLGIGDCVRLLGFRDDVTAIMQAADVFVLPSLNEPFGLVLLEAMALGRPIVATAAGGPLEIVEHNVGGLLVPPRSAQDMAAAIEEILSDPARAEQMGRAGRERFEKHFTVQKMAAATAGVYRSALS